jgi:hypothetical protein
MPPSWRELVVVVAMAHKGDYSWRAGTGSSVKDAENPRNFNVGIRPFWLRLVTTQ